MKRKSPKKHSTRQLHRYKCCKALARHLQRTIIHRYLDYSNNRNLISYDQHILSNHCFLSTLHHPTTSLYHFPWVSWRYFHLNLLFPHFGLHHFCCSWPFSLCPTLPALSDSTCLFHHGYQLHPWWTLHSSRLLWAWSFGYRFCLVNHRFNVLTFVGQLHVLFTRWNALFRYWSFSFYMEIVLFPFLSMNQSGHLTRLHTRRFVE